MNEFQTKQNTIITFMADHQVDALLLNKVSSFAWATCGASSFINRAVTDGAASLLITPKNRYLITSTIEGPRLSREEKLVDQGWELVTAPWYESNNLAAELSKGYRLGADGIVAGAIDLSAQISRLRSVLLLVEMERFRELGRLCAEAMEEAIRLVRPGQSEYEIAAHLSEASERRGVQAIVNLIATDERVFNFRHPLPTDKKMERYAMLVLCGRRWGLVCSVTRLVHFGRISEELKHKQQAVAQIDATFIANTRPGHSLGQIFDLATEAYKQSGFANEWKLHHQGGPAGYEPREIVATPGSTDQVAIGQVYAWNPSITGTKSEDTILIAETGNQILSEIPGWPTVVVEINQQEIKRPIILEVI